MITHGILKMIRSIGGMESKITMLLQQLAEEWEKYQHEQHVEHRKLEKENVSLKEELHYEHQRLNTLINSMGDLFDRLRGNN